MKVALVLTSALLTLSLPATAQSARSTDTSSPAASSFERQKGDSSTLERAETLSAPKSSRGAQEPNRPHVSRSVLEPPVSIGGRPGSTGRPASEDSRGEYVSDESQEREVVLVSRHAHESALSSSRAKKLDKASEAQLDPTSESSDPDDVGAELIIPPSSRAEVQDDGTLASSSELSASLEEGSHPNLSRNQDALQAGESTDLERPDQLRFTDTVLFGQGHAGSLGIPSLHYMGQGGPGATVTLVVENSSGLEDAGAYLLVGTSQVSVPTRGGGEIVVSTDIKFDRLRLDAGTNSVSLTLPSYIDVNAVYVQILQRDTGAKGGYSMTRGMKVALD